MVKQTIRLHDINQISTDGYVVFPISMSRISNSQSAEECYKWLEFLKKRYRYWV